MQEDSRVKYEEWKKTRKDFHFTFNDIKVIDGQVVITGYVGDHSIHVGDYIGGQKVVRIQAYGTDHEQSGGGLGCAITFNSMPSFVLEETDPEGAEWLDRRANERDKGI